MHCTSMQLPVATAILRLGFLAVFLVFFLAGSEGSERGGVGFTRHLEGWFLSSALGERVLGPGTLSEVEGGEVLEVITGTSTSLLSREEGVHAFPTSLPGWSFLFLSLTFPLLSGGGVLPLSLFFRAGEWDAGGWLDVTQTGNHAASYPSGAAPPSRSPSRQGCAVAAQQVPWWRLKFYVDTPLRSRFLFATRSGVTTTAMDGFVSVCFCWSPLGRLLCSQRIVVGRRGGDE